MREDMAQVIVERPRLGGANSRKGRSKDWGDLPSREGMRRPHLLRGAPRELNENLAPLRRYLERQVGRPWDKVYAEIALRLRVDNAVQQHVRNHLHDFVAVKPRRMRRWHWQSSDLWWQRLYVDPRTGLLRRTDRLPEEKARRRVERDRRPRPVDRIPLSVDRELRLVTGIWYEVRLATLPEPVYRTVEETVKVPRKRHSNGGVIVLKLTVRRLATPAVLDAVTHQHVPAGPEVDEANSWKAYRRTYPDRRYAIAKRCLSRRELRRHGLANEALEDALTP